MQWKQRRPLDHEFEIKNENYEAQMFHTTGVLWCKRRIPLKYHHSPCTQSLDYPDKLPCFLILLGSSTSLQKLECILFMDSWSSFQQNTFCMFQSFLKPLLSCTIQPPTLPTSPNTSCGSQRQEWATEHHDQGHSQLQRSEVMLHWNQITLVVPPGLTPLV